MLRVWLTPSFSGADLRWSFELREPRIDRLFCGLLEYAAVIEKTSSRIGTIVAGMRSFMRISDNDPLEDCVAQSIVNEALVLCSERFRNAGIDLGVEGGEDSFVIQARSVQICQVLVNLLNNAHDAVENLPRK